MIIPKAKISDKAKILPQTTFLIRNNHQILSWIICIHHMVPYNRSTPEMLKLINPALLRILRIMNVTHFEGSFFWQNSHPFHFIQTDSEVKRKHSSALLTTTSSIDWYRLSSWIDGKLDNTSSTCKMSYQTKGIFSFRKSVPILKRNGLWT